MVFTMLKKIKHIQNVGRFAKANLTQVKDVNYGRCVLIFGENGSGKSTISDILRSLSDSNTDPIVGRKTLNGGAEQEIILDIDSNNVVFENENWKGNSAPPRIAIYDSTFVNENVYSGDIVSADHLKNQYGLVVGETAVKLLRGIQDIDDEREKINKDIEGYEKNIRSEIGSASNLSLGVDEIIQLKSSKGINENIAKKKQEISRLEKFGELMAAAVPEPFIVPTESSIFEKLLASTVDSIGKEALTAVREHIAKCKGRGQRSEVSHESWLEAGVPYLSSDDCPFCGQELLDTKLVAAYEQYFAGAYKKLAKSVNDSRKTLEQYSNREFRKTVLKRNKANAGSFEYWKLTGGLKKPQMENIQTIVTDMEQTAIKLDDVLLSKQANLIEAQSSPTQRAALKAWKGGRDKLVKINRTIGIFLEQIKCIRSATDPTLLKKTKHDMAYLVARKHRHSDDVKELIKMLRKAQKRRKLIDKNKENLRAMLTNHTASITKKLGKQINDYLERVNAGFSIDYSKTVYRSKKPSANYQIVINDIPVPSRSENVDPRKPNFRNTLSSGDKSVMALAFFLAQVNADANLRKSIIVLDDPFTSLDSFRRQFTAVEIHKLCRKADQVIVLSHDKNFLHLLWKRTKQTLITSLRIKPGVDGCITIDHHDIEKSNRSRFEAERADIQDFLNNETDNSTYIRTRLRTVCEKFYRRSDPSIFEPNVMLGRIIEILKNAPPDHPHKGDIEQLQDINCYSRSQAHGEVSDNPEEESDDEELKSYCKMVLKLTKEGATRK